MCQDVFYRSYLTNYEMSYFVEMTDSINSDASWTIQTAVWRDFAELNQLEKTCFSVGDHWPFWDLLGALTLPGLVRLKAVASGKMVGFIGAERDALRRRGWVTTLAVLPAYQRQGIARALLAKCEMELGMSVVRLSVRASNAPAISLYQSAGYALVDQWKKYYVGGETALIFEKKFDLARNDGG